LKKQSGSLNLTLKVSLSVKLTMVVQKETKAGQNRKDLGGTGRSFRCTCGIVVKKKTHQGHPKELTNRERKRFNFPKNESKKGVLSDPKIASGRLPKPTPLDKAKRRAGPETGAP